MRAICRARQGERRREGERAIGTERNRLEGPVVERVFHRVDARQIIERFAGHGEVTADCLA